MELLILCTLVAAAMLPCWVVVLRLAGVPLVAALEEAMRAVGGGLVMTAAVWLILLAAAVLGGA